MRRFIVVLTHKGERLREREREREAESGLNIVVE
jgi:hypothetical protein